MKKQTLHRTSRNTLMSLAFGVVVVLLATGLLYQNTQIAHLKNDLASQSQLLSNTINSIDSSQQATAAVLNPADNRVYIPELRISLPYNDVAKTLRYTYGERDGARFYSTLVTDRSMHRISCYDMLRAKYEATPNAYSPGQPHAATVAVGERSLQLYQETNDECAAQAWLQITPAQITNELKQAQAY